MLLIFHFLHDHEHAGKSRNGSRSKSLSALSEPTALIEIDLCNQQDYKRHLVLAILNVKRLSVTQTLNLRPLYRLINNASQNRGIMECRKTEGRKVRERDFEIS